MLPEEFIFEMAPVFRPPLPPVQETGELKDFSLRIGLSIEVFTTMGVPLPYLVHTK